MFKAKDILKVIQLVDLDGVFVDDSKIKESNVKNPHYEEDCILCSKPESIRQRNHRKINILKRLISLPKVWRTVDYKVYFFSCNLDHVIHNERNLEDNLKNDYAQNFAIKYKDDIPGFVNFFLNSEFSLKGNYQSTWDFVSKDDNSLKRFTNFNLLLEDILQEE